MLFMVLPTAPCPQSGFIVAFVPFKNGVPSGPYEIFADNFAQVEPLISVSDAMYRPMGLAMGPHGALYVVILRWVRSGKSGIKEIRIAFGRFS